MNGPNDTSERNQSLWLLTAAPVIWAVHFLTCYITAAIWCAKVAGRDGSLAEVRVAIAVLTVVALIGIGLVGRSGYRRHRFGGATIPHDFDSREDRHRFIGFATLLLSAMSAVATLYSAMVAIFFWSCQ